MRRSADVKGKRFGLLLRTAWICNNVFSQSISELGMMVAVEDFKRNKLREGRRPDAGDDVEQNGGLEEMELTIDGNHDLLLGVNNSFF